VSNDHPFSPDALQHMNPALYVVCQACQGHTVMEGAANADCSECGGQGFILYPLGMQIVELIRLAFPQLEYVNALPASQRKQALPPRQAYVPESQNPDTDQKPTDDTD
jgi:hypothetical protein